MPNPPVYSGEVLRKKPSATEIAEGGMCKITAINRGFIAQEPGLMVANAVARVGKRGWFPMMVCNETGKQIETIRSDEMQPVDSEAEPALAGINAICNTDTDELNAPDEYKGALEELTNEFRDMFAEKRYGVGENSGHESQY